MKYILTQLVFILVIAHSSLGQNEDNYYLFPIRPGEQNYLAGTMGELRSSHFHAGLDIKTGGQTGWPVYAAADGYVSRIRISNGGYGHALYLNHPNGTTTVYAHLSKYGEDIANYVLQEQYNQQTFTIQLFPKKEQFQVKKGDIIAYSGNTGSSTGPHLHFEIRNKNQHILDPLKYRFSEIKDQITPQVKRIAFVTLDGNARINGMYGRYEFDVLKTGNSYKPRVPIALSGKIGIEIYAYDLLNGVYNRNGIPETTLVIGQDTIFREVKNALNFSLQKTILVHMDYARYKKGGPKFNKLFLDEGNNNSIYPVRSSGYYFDEDTVQHITIYLKDSYENLSVMEATVNNRRVINKPDASITNYAIFRNHLHLKHFNSTGSEPITVYHGGHERIITPYRESSKVNYGLYDLRTGIPDSVRINGNTEETDIYALLPSGHAMTFFNHDFELSLHQRTLFDTLYLRFNKSYDTLNKQELFEFPLQTIPFRRRFSLTLKPANTYPDSSARVYAKYGKRLSYIGGQWEEGMISFNTSSFGTFTIAEDTIPPTITPKKTNKQPSLYFKITDDLSGIKEYRATLNGEFLLMSYEYKENLIWATPRNENISLTGELVLEVSDNTGNKTVYHQNLK